MKIRLVGRIFDFLVSTGLWVSLSAGLLTFSTATFFETEFRSSVALIVGGSTAAMYGYISFIQSFNKNHKRSSLLLSEQFVSLLTGLAGAILVLAQSEHLNARGLPVLAIGFVISVLYPVRIFGMSLRQIPGLKIFAITLVWLLSCFIFPLVNSDSVQNLGFEIYLSGASVWLLLLAATIPFDMRDLQFDHPQLKTIPQLVGLQKARIFVWILTLVSSGLWALSGAKFPYGYFLFTAHFAIFSGTFNPMFMRSQRTVPLFFEGAFMIPGIAIIMADIQP